MNTAEEELTEEEKGVIDRIIRIIPSSLSIRDTYSSIATELRKVIDFDRMSIALLAEEAGFLVTYVASVRGESTQLTEGQVYPLKSSLVERVFTTGEAIIVEDTLKGEFSTNSYLLKNGLRSRLGYPLKVKGRLIGSLNFSSRKPALYSARHLLILGQLAPILAMAIENTQLFEKTKEAAIRDPLTEAYNRRYLFERLEEEILRSKRYGYHFSLFLCDINGFKQANDRYGHSFGDKLLKAMVSITKDTLRRTDILCRYGGDEFVIILPETDRLGAFGVASKINKALSEQTPEDTKSLFPLEVSIGVVVYPLDGQSSDELLLNADHACYRAKSQPGHVYPPLEGS